MPRTVHESSLLGNTLATNRPGQPIQCAISEHSPSNQMPQIDQFGAPPMRLDYRSDALPLGSDTRPFSHAGCALPCGTPRTAWGNVYAVLLRWPCSRQVGLIRYRQVHDVRLHFAGPEMVRVQQEDAGSLGLCYGFRRCPLVGLHKLG